MGDFNINYLDAKNHFDIKTLLAQWGFSQTIKQATRVNDNTSTLIDVILTSRQNNITKTYFIPIAFSDHDMICCVRKLNWQKYQPKQINCRDYKNHRKERLCEELQNNNWQPVIDANDVNDAWQKMKDIIRSCLDQIAPKIIKRIRGKPCPWMTPELKQQMSERDRLQRRYRKSKLPAHKNEYKRKRNSVNSLVKKAKQNYFKNLLENSANDPDSFWNNSKKIFPNKQKSSAARFTIDCATTSDSKPIANAFCSYFSKIVLN